MHKILPVLLCLLAFVFVGNAYAQNSSNSATTPRDYLLEKRPMTGAPGMNKTASLSAKRMDYNTKLQNIGDVSKQSVVGKIDTRLNALNVSQTKKWNEDLSKMTMVLNRISTEGSKLEAQGKSTIALNASIKTAQASIASAQAAVNAQADKDYVPTITTEAALRVNVGSVVSQFRADSNATRQMVQAARVSVVKAAAELAKLALTDDMMKASNSAGVMRQ